MEVSPHLESVVAGRRGEWAAKQSKPEIPSRWQVVRGSRVVRLKSSPPVLSQTIMLARTKGGVVGKAG
jgi:hypothetical protein